MAEGFKRIEGTDVTDGLMLAMEHAGKMDAVVVIHLAKTEEEESGGFILPKGCTLETVLWMVESFKHWLMSGATGVSDG